MLTRYLLAALCAFSLLACSRLSPQERKLVGIWERQNYDGSEYFILESDRSCKFIGGADPNKQRPRHLLGYIGTWRIEGDDIVFDWTEPEWIRRDDRQPRKSSLREPVAYFLNYMKRHQTLAYDEQPEI